jgi:fimbrial isopeptide formation D2 family protein/LPXTG-motif cell wall-anchored protein
MKRLKKCLSLFLALMMLLGCMTMFASATTGNDALQNSGEMNLTIHASENTHRYVLYQIFTGIPNTDGTLTNIQWGTSILKTGSYDLRAELITELKKSTLPDGTTSHISTYFSALNETSSADYVAAAYTKLDNTTAVNLHEFATIVDYVITTKAPEGVTVDQYTNPTLSGDKASGYKYLFSNIAGGFYLVDEDPDPANNNTTVSYSRYILSIATKDATMNDKSQSNPTLEKQIVTSTDANAVGTSYTQAAIGDLVTFRLKSTVPDMSYYGSYYFIVNDTLSKGLTYDASTADMTVTVGGNTLTNKAGAAEGNTMTYEVVATPQTDGTTKLEIVFNNFIQYKALEGNKDVVIWYKAKLNENAVIGKGAGEANTNMASLTYSNNPNYIYEGKNGDKDRPGTDEPVGKTPDSTVYVYTTAIDLFKKDPSGQALTGAKFKIDGTALNTVVVKKKEFQKVDTVPDGTKAYYLLSDGTYTETKPTEETLDKYDASNCTYILKETTSTETTTENVSKEIEVGKDGYLHLTGLKAGNYTITETVAPTGFETLKEPVKVSITYTDPDAAQIANGCGWSAEIITENGTRYDGAGLATLGENNTTGRINLEVENTVEKTLPSTGGMGTTLFYVVGSVLVLGAAVLLITKRRMKNSNE